MPERRHLFVVICLLCACMVVEGGCWGRTFFRMPRETIETSAKADSLIRENAELRRRIVRIERILDEQKDYSRSANAQLKMDLEELKDQLNVLQEMLRDADQSSYYRPVGTVREGGREQRGNDAGREGLTAGGERRAQPADASSNDSQGEPVDTVSIDTLHSGRPEALPPAEEIHRQVYLDFSRGEYQIAIEESGLFLEKYGDHPLAQEVLFIRGECFMEQEKYFDALKEFSRILQEFPKGKRIPATLLRMAIAYESIGENEVAAGVVRRLLREHPYSEEAALAEERYKELLEE
jgi:TolA-binding protein